MNIRFQTSVTAALMLGLMVLAPTGIAAERIVYGRVLETTPIPAGDIDAAPRCAPPVAPASTEGLAAALRHELLEQPAAERRCRAERKQALAGYRVRYLWNGREFEDVVPTPPGRTIALRLHID